MSNQHLEANVKEGILVYGISYYRSLQRMRERGDISDEQFKSLESAYLDWATEFERFVNIAKAEYDPIGKN